MLGGPGLEPLRIYRVQEFEIVGTQTQETLTRYSQQTNRNILTSCHHFHALQV